MAIESLFDRPEFHPYKQQWDARRAEFASRHAYYSGDVYNRFKYRFGFAMAQKLYRGIRPLYLPFARAVDVDAGIIPGNWALPTETPDQVKAARDVLFKWSEWATQGVLFVHYGAIYGNSMLKVADLREQKRVIIAPVNPQMAMVIGATGYGRKPELSIYLEQRTGTDGKAIEVAEVITASDIRTFINGHPAGVDGRKPEYKNELGAVPYIEVKHIEAGDPLGQNTFWKAQAILDELNNLGSYLADIIKKHADPQYAASGVAASDLRKGENVWFLPDGASIEAILADIDIGGVRGFLGDLNANIKESLPETAFDELRSKDQIATATIELQLAELTYKVKRCRPNYDAGLVEALNMAGAAADSMGVGELSPLASDGLTLNDERPVLRAELGQREILDYLLKSGAPNEAIWQALDVPPEQIAEWQQINAKKQQQFNNMIDANGENDP